MTRRLQQKDIKILWGFSAARCAYPKCRLVCVLEADEYDKTATIGKIAHIVAHSDKGPRGNPDFPESERYKYENLILLCPTHHDIVDAKPYKFNVATMHGWKTNLEKWVRNSLLNKMPEVTFAELEVVTKAIVSGPSQPVTDFTVLDPTEKMNKNGLSDDVRFFLTMGLGKAREVGSFVEHVASRDVDFPERLKAGFVDEYRQHMANGVIGDELFESLRVFASNGSVDFGHQAAGLAILCYLFEKCEVFES